MSPVLILTFERMEIHLMDRNKPGMTNTKVRRIEKVRAKRNGIIIVQQIDIKTFHRMEKDCQMIVICRQLSEIFRDTSEKMSCNKKNTLCH